jgi:hypothetical protein
MKRKVQGETSSSKENGRENDDKKINWSLIISILALGVSLGVASVSFATFYFQFWRFHEDLKVTVLTATPEYDGTACTADIVFTNNGNQQSSIVAINLLWHDPDSKILTGPFSIQCEHLAPFNVNSKDVVSKQIRIGTEKNITTAIENYLNAGDGRIVYHLVFDVVDSKGRYHVATIPVFTKIIGQSGWELPGKEPRVLQLLPSQEVSPWAHGFPRNKGG